MKTARVIEEHKTNYVIVDGDFESIATVRGTFFTDDMFPKVGDFVRYEEVGDGKTVIEEIVPRTSTVARKAVDSESLQVIVANVDVIFVVMGLDNDFNISRLERYVLLATQSEVPAVVILNKRDAVDDVAPYIEAVQKAVGTVPVYAVSALAGEGMEVFFDHIAADTTAVLLGSSGAGKSTVTNWLLQEDAQRVKDVRADDSRGKHTTTSRQLFALPHGGYLIDTPGMRELSVVDSTSEAEETVFAQIDELSRQCQFSNCDHEKSQGCAIMAAIEAGDIEERQLQSYHKLQRERLFAESKTDESHSIKQKQRQKKLHKSYSKAQQKKRFNNQF